MTPEDDAGSEVSVDGPKSRRERFRDKLKQKLDRSGSTSNDEYFQSQEVQTFLKPAPEDFLYQHPVPSATPLPSRKAIPKIDVSVSQRYPGAQEVEGPRLVVPGQNLRSRSASPPRKRQKNKGLTVKFADDPPHVIGEGGDESEVPTKDVLRTRASSHPPMLERPRQAEAPLPSSLEIGQKGPSPPGVPVMPPRSRSSQDSDFVKPQVLIRAPTGALDETRPGSSSGRQDREFEMSLGAPAVQPVQRERSLPPVDQERRQSMHAEEAKSLHLGLREASPDPSPEVSPIDGSHAPLPRAPSLKHKSGQRFDDNRNLSPLGPNHSTDSFHSASSHNSYVVSPMTPPPAHVEPPILSTTGVPLTTSPPTVNQRPSTTTTPSNQARSGSYSTDPPPYPAAPDSASTQTSLRSDNMKPSQQRGSRHRSQLSSEEALLEFLSYINPYFSLFPMAAESSKPLFETTLPEWLRASVWWFHRGEAEIRKLLRARPRSSDAPFPVEATVSWTQALVDLAKSWWIVQNMIPQHPDVMRYGSMPIPEVILQARTNQDEWLISLLGVHQMLVNLFRGLTASMKRNGLIPQVTGEPVLQRGLDTGIWVRYPSLAPEIINLLSSSGSRSLFLQKSSQTFSIDEIMPIKDTEQQFVHARIFAMASVVGRNNQATNYVPSLITLYRNPGTYQFILAVASQNNLINLVVHNNRQDVLKWQQVDLIDRSNIVSLRLPGDIALDCQLTPEDYTKFRGWLSISSLATGSLKQRPGELPALQMVTKGLQLVTPDATLNFPTEKLRRCRCSVFEVTTNEYSSEKGRRVSHRGLRLAFVTSPSMHVLAALNLEFSTSRPFTYSLLKDQEDASPALMLSVPTEQGTRLVVVSFHDQAERQELLNVLLGTAITEQGTTTEVVQLRSFSIEPLPDTPRSILAQGQWKELEIVAEPQLHEGQVAPTSTSPKRICLTYGAGSITDRVNLGENL